MCIYTYLLTLSAYAQEGYCSCRVFVCLSVTTLAATSLVSTLEMRFIVFRFLTRGFSIQPSVQKLGLKSHVIKTNMQMSMYSSGLVLVRFEYHAWIDRANTE